MGEEKCVVGEMRDPEVEEIIEILEAYRKGEKIEVAYKDRSDWIEVDNPVWDFEHYDYRVKTIHSNAEVVAEKLREIGFEVDTDILRRGCPVPYSKEYSKDYQCGSSVNCSSCKKWWDKEWKEEEE